MKLYQNCPSEARKKYKNSNEVLLKSIEKHAVGLANNAIKYHLRMKNDLMKVIELT